MFGNREQGVGHRTNSSDVKTKENAICMFEINAETRQHVCGWSFQQMPIN